MTTKVRNASVTTTPAAKQSSQLSGGKGELVDEAKLDLEILRHCPFKAVEKYFFKENTSACQIQ